MTQSKELSVDMDVISKRWLMASMFIYLIAIITQNKAQSLVTLCLTLCMVWWAVNWRIAAIKETIERMKK